MHSVSALIPVLLGSTRIPDKNIIYVDGQPLCCYAVATCRKAGVFESVSLYSEDDVFITIAEQEGARFVRRPAEWGGRACAQNTKSRNCAGKRCVINEHYLYYFMRNATEADYVCQVNATSPLLKPETVATFVRTMIDGNYDSFFAAHTIRAESFHRGAPVSFSRKRKAPSNELEPLQTICWAIAGWKREAFLACYERDDPLEDAPVFGGKLGVFPIDEREALDIDEWSTLDVAEAFLKARREHAPREWRYLDGRRIIRE